MAIVLVEALVGLISVAIAAAGVALAANYKAASNVIAARVDRYALSQGGAVADDVWGRSPAALRWYGAGVTLVGIFGLGLAIRWNLIVLAACVGLGVALLGGTLSGFRNKVKTAPLLAPPTRIWEIIGWGLVLGVLFVLGAVSEVLLANAPRLF
jgi:hypothetical protein